MSHNNNKIFFNFFKEIFDGMVGRVGYAPTTPAMSMQYSTIELTARNLIQIFISFI